MFENTRIQILQIPTIANYRGSLSFMETQKPLPFTIGCVYCIYADKEQEDNKAQLLSRQEKIIVALTGNIEILVTTPPINKKYSISHSNRGLYMPSGTDATSIKLSNDAICLVIEASCNKLPQGSLKEEDTIPFYKVSDCSLTSFPLHNEAANQLVYSNNLPFSIERLFYIHATPTGIKRGMHAHTYCHEILIATSGSIEVELNDGCTQKTILLNNPTQGLHIPPGIWATQLYKTQNASCLVLASNRYNEEGYIHSYSQFEKYKSNGN